MDLGAELEIAFELPRAGLIETRAETSYQLVPDTGLVFQATPAASRRAILSYVEENLAASARPPPQAASRRLRAPRIL
jgi:hypothetical protein